jgi:hypothetical protein
VTVDGGWESVRGLLGVLLSSVRAERPERPVRPRAALRKRFASGKGPTPPGDVVSILLPAPRIVEGLRVS